VNDVATLYEALGEKQRSPEHLNELLLNLGKITAKAYKRSVRSCEQLKAVREMLFQVSVEVLCSLIQKTSCIPSFDQQISKNMASKASTIGQDMLSNAGPDDDAVPFNGVETCFITFPRNIAAVETDIWPPSNLYLGSTFDDDEDSDDEGEVVQKKPSARAAWISYPKPKHMSFANVKTQLESIAQGMSPFIEHFSRLVCWWGRMKDGLEGLKDAFPQLVLDRPMAAADVANGWKGVGDQFAVYIYKATPIATDYIPHPRNPAQPMPSRLPPLPSVSVAFGMYCLRVLLLIGICILVAKIGDAYKRVF